MRVTLSMQSTLGFAAKGGSLQGQARSFGETGGAAKRLAYVAESPHKGRRGHDQRSALQVFGGVSVKRL